MACRGVDSDTEQPKAKNEYAANRQILRTHIAIVPTHSTSDRTAILATSLRRIT
jgi:hypothetical protein